MMLAESIECYFFVSLFCLFVLGHNFGNIEGTAPEPYNAPTANIEPYWLLNRQRELGFFKNAELRKRPEKLYSSLGLPFVGSVRVFNIWEVPPFLAG